MNKRLVISWVVSSIFMFTAFYIWHGVLLNDFSRIEYSPTLFLIFAGITYVALGYALVKVFEMPFWKKLRSGSFLRAILVGLSLGFLMFIITRVLGVSFGSNKSLIHMLVDLVWQMTEQIIGSLAVLISSSIVFLPAED